MNRGRHKKSNKNDSIDLILAKYGYKITDNAEAVRTILQMAVNYIKRDHLALNERISIEWAIMAYIKNPYDSFYFYNTKEGATIWKIYASMINTSIKSIRQSNLNRI